MNRRKMDADTFSFLWKGILLGMNAGFSPGPVITLLMTESLRHGRRAGIRFAFVPLLTDLPVVAIAIPVLYCLTFNASAAIGGISMAGALVLGSLGYKCLKVTQSQFERDNVARMPLAQAVGVNFCNPNLYIYWIAICGPICVTALHISFGILLVFLVSFYVSITSVKICIALIVGSIRHTLNLKIIVWINRCLGAAIFIFAILFFYQGWQLLTGAKSIRP